jgi:hypothetical protein
MTGLPVDKGTEFLWIHKQADDLTSREHLPAVNSNVQLWQKPLSKDHHASNEKMIVPRTQFRWRLRGKKDKTEARLHYLEVQKAH